MTATLNEASLDVPVDVRFTATGTPLAVRFDGRVWAVAADPVHWFTRDSSARMLHTGITRRFLSSDL